MARKGSVDDDVPFCFDFNVRQSQPIITEHVELNG